MDQLTNREIATFLWGSIIFFVFLLYSFKNEKLRLLLISTAQSLFNIKIIIPILIISVYVIITIFLLNLFKFWDISQLKNTLVWYFTVALGTLFKINSIKNRSNNFFIEFFKPLINLTIFLEFVINFYSFGFFIEFLLVIPIVTFLSILSTVATLSKQHQKVKILLDLLLSVIFILFFINFINTTLQDHSSFFNIKSFQNFLIPIFLTLLFLPFIWILLLYISYEEVFVRLPIFIKNKNLIPLIKLHLFISFNFKKDHLSSWFDYLKIHKIKTKKELIHSILFIKERKRIEKNPPVIPLEIGWCPYQAQKFLSSHNLQPIRYCHIGDSIWFCSSTLKLDDSFDSPTISYYIQGNEQYVTQLKLKLFLYDINNIDTSLDIYLNILDKLLNDSTQTILSVNQIKLISNRKNFNFPIKNKILTFEYEEFHHIIPVKCEFYILLKNISNSLEN